MQAIIFRAPLEFGVLGDDMAQHSPILPPPYSMRNSCQMEILAITSAEQRRPQDETGRLVLKPTPQN